MTLSTKGDGDSRESQRGPLPREGFPESSHWRLERCGCGPHGTPLLYPFPKVLHAQRLRIRPSPHPEPQKPAVGVPTFSLPSAFSLRWPHSRPEPRTQASPSFPSPFRPPPVSPPSKIIKPPGRPHISQTLLKSLLPVSHLLSLLFPSIVPHPRSRRSLSPHILIVPPLHICPRHIVLSPPFSLLSRPIGTPDVVRRTLVHHRRLQRTLLGALMSRTRAC